MDSRDLKYGLEVHSDEDFKDTYLTLLSNHAYPKLLSTIDSKGKDVSYDSLMFNAWNYEQQGFYILLLYFSYSNQYFISFSPRTNLTGYFPAREIEC